MTRCKYLEGENVKPKTIEEAKKLIGQRIIYLRSLDIDKSGRGYFFPKYGVVSNVFFGCLVVNGEWISYRSKRDIVEITINKKGEK